MSTEDGLCHRSRGIETGFKRLLRLVFVLEFVALDGAREQAVGNCIWRRGRHTQACGLGAETQFLERRRIELAGNAQAVAGLKLLY